MAELNRMTLARGAWFGRLIGTVLMVVGALGVVAWIWVVLRQQGLAGEEEGFFAFGTGSENLSLNERFDSFANSLFYLLTQPSRLAQAWPSA